MNKLPLAGGAVCDFQSRAESAAFQAAVCSISFAPRREFMLDLVGPDSTDFNGQEPPAALIEPRPVAEGERVSENGPYVEAKRRQADGTTRYCCASTTIFAGRWAVKDVSAGAPAGVSAPAETPGTQERE